MNTALSWIKAYVPSLSCTDQEYFDAMTLSGTKVEGFERLDKNLEKIVIGQIEEIEKHPDADKLIVCQVNVGGRHRDQGRQVKGRPLCRNDVLYRRAGQQPRDVSGSARKRHLYF